MKKAYLGVDIGSISTKAVIIDSDNGDFFNHGFLLFLSLCHVECSESSYPCFLSG